MPSLSAATLTLRVRRVRSVRLLLWLTDKSLSLLPWGDLRRRLARWACARALSLLKFERQLSGRRWERLRPTGGLLNG